MGVRGKREDCVWIHSINKRVEIHPDLSHPKHVGLDPCPVVTHADGAEQLLQLVRVVKTLDCQPNAVHHQQSVTPQFSFVDLEAFFPILHNHLGEKISKFFRPRQKAGTVIMIFYLIARMDSYLRHYSRRALYFNFGGRVGCKYKAPACPRQTFKMCYVMKDNILIYTVKCVSDCNLTHDVKQARCS